MPFGPGTYPPGDPRNQGVDPMMGGGMPMGGMDTQNPLILALLQLLMSGQMPMGGGMAGSPSMPAQPQASPLLDFLRGPEAGGGAMY